MIKIRKGQAPSVLTSDGVEFQVNATKFAMKLSYDEKKFKAKFKKYCKIASNNQFGGFKSDLFSWAKHYSHASVKRQLIVEHHGKCAFCECFIMDADRGDVEHYRPNAEITILNHDKRTDCSTVDDHPGYFWLSQTWNNLFLSCKECNQRYKQNLFDVFPGNNPQDPFPRHRHDKPNSQETALLLHPSIDEPRDFLYFDPSTAKVRPGAKLTGFDIDYSDMPRADRTTKITGLNRPRLVQARAAHLMRLRSLFLLAASSPGAHIPANAQQLDVLDFSYLHDCAGSDAVTALEWSIEPFAEFSALAQDAIAAWNRELKSKTVVIQVPNNIRTSINVPVASDLRLIDQFNLAEKNRVDNANSTEYEAEPDTIDLDIKYNEKLNKYKELVSEARKNRRKLDQSYTGQVQYRQKLNDGQKKIDELLDRINDLKFKLRNEKEKGISNNQYVQQIELELQQLAQQHEQSWKNLDPLVNNLEKVSEPVEIICTQLLDLFEDVHEINESYRNCGAPADRFNRASLLKDSVSNFMDFIENLNTVLTESVRQQIEQNKGWPPQITIKG